MEYNLVRAMLPKIVLSLISENKTMHGYSLISTIRRNHGRYFGPSTVYPLLSKMEDDGLVTSEWKMNGEKPIKQYQVTAKGTATLRDLSLQIIMIAGNRGEHDESLLTRKTS